MRDRSVLVTGASSGIGAALARAYAEPGRRLLLLGRDAERLEASAASCRARGAEVETGMVDVRDREALAAWIGAADSRQPIDVAIANAGIAGGPSRGQAIEPIERAARIVEVNLIGAMATAAAIAERMAARRSGQIVLISSLAGLRGIPALPAYSASKAGLRAYGDAIRPRLARVGVGLTTVHPGFVTTPMTETFRGWRAFELPADKAAAIIKRGIDRRQAVVAFPRRLTIGLRLLPLFPTRFGDLFMGPFSADAAPEPEETKRG